ncbi:MAG: Nif3-like dinuclear metal center hexameric protein [Chromatiales bacterium]|jgi:dinuclear metal center YbgI/SA1388 family protein|nr:Nif3-like dinuclear metal center hexameric protein [Chromatiales bacterium]
MTDLHALDIYLDELLTPARFMDYAPNGLQVEGRAQVARIVGGVTASLALIEAAVAAHADAIVVHHGWFWKNEDMRVRGMKRARLALLLEHEISLLAYHLPLDAHPDVGNNVQLARVLGLRITGSIDTGVQPSLLLRGETPSRFTPEDFAAHIAVRLGRAALHIAGGPDRIATVAWCTGAGQDYIEIAARSGVDAFISGEISERTTHIAREAGIHYYAAGHHATERYGVQALGARIAQRFNIDFSFVDVENPA